MGTNIDKADLCACNNSGQLPKAVVGGCLKSGSLSLTIILNPPSPDLLFESGCGVTIPPGIAVLL